MKFDTMRKMANLKKSAGISDWPTVAAAAVVTLAFLGSFTGGYFAGKVTQPSHYDKENLNKQYALSRITRDNQTQQILAAREAAERDMRNKPQKAMRIA